MSSRRAPVGSVKVVHRINMFITSSLAFGCRVGCHRRIFDAVQVPHCSNLRPTSPRVFSVDTLHYHSDTLAKHPFPPHQCKRVFLLH